MKYALLGARTIGGGTPDRASSSTGMAEPWASVKDLKSDEISQTTDTFRTWGCSVRDPTSQLVP